MNLTAYWSQKADPCTDDPHSVYWEDGSPATVADYRRHAEGTYEDIYHYPGRVARRLYLGVKGGVRWDYDRRDWRVSGLGIRPFFLAIDDPDACDERIVAELSIRPIAYACEIIRCSLRLSHYSPPEPPGPADDIEF